MRRTGAAIVVDGMRWRGWHARLPRNAYPLESVLHRAVA
jgi:hypothetical protein